MSYYATPRRPVRRKKDSTPIVIAVIAVMGIPALAFAVYKLVIDKPAPVAAVPTVDDSAFSPSRRTAPSYSPAPLPRTQMTANDAQFESRNDAATTFTSGTPYNFGTGDVSFSPGSSYSGGGMSGGSGNVSAAINSVGDKIKESVGLGKTLVIWLIDRTPSCEARRQEVARQLDSLYANLSAGDKDAKPEDAKLLSAVCSFAADVQYETKEPTADLNEIRSALSNVKTDSGNVENTFKAVETVVEQYASYAAPPHQRYLTVVVVTDEVGNDQQARDRTADVLRRNSIPLYVIGKPAAFGSTGAQEAGAEGAGGQISGPESHDLEWIALDFPGGMSMGGPAGQDCGVGPYGLTYLCRESGGEYYAAGSYGMSVTLPPQYLPRYLSEKDYQAQVGSNKALAALAAAAQLKRAQQISGPQTSFEVDENGLAVVRDIDMAQRPVALIMPEINNLFDTLKKGESDRAKLTEPRQQAAFDLALGRAMAAKVRAEGYIVLLAAFKAGRKTSKGGPGIWSLSPADGIEKNSVLESTAKKAREYLQGVIDKHPGTPWAQAAQQELSMPIGWAWQES